MLNCYISVKCILGTRNTSKSLVKAYISFHSGYGFYWLEANTDKT